MCLRILTLELGRCRPRAGADQGGPGGHPGIEPRITWRGAAATEMRERGRCGSAGNSKSEIRRSKQYQMSEGVKFETAQPAEFRFDDFFHSLIRVCFGFRYSNFEFSGRRHGRIESSKNTMISTDSIADYTDGLRQLFSLPPRSQNLPAVVGCIWERICPRNSVSLRSTPVHGDEGRRTTIHSRTFPIPLA